MQRPARLAKMSPSHLSALETRVVDLLVRRLPQDLREEWLGDLHEARDRLLASGYSCWAVSFITIGRTVLLGWSLIVMSCYDFVHGSKGATRLPATYCHHHRTGFCGFRKGWDMGPYIVKRLLLMIPTLFGAALLVFFLMSIVPGDIALLIIGGDQGGDIDPIELANLREQLGLNRPLYMQFLSWLWGVVRLDFGTSLWTGETVTHELLIRLPLTLEIAIVATFVSIMLALPLGTLAAIRQDTWVDYVIRVVSIGGLAIPSFWTGILVILFLVLLFEWSPPLEFVSLFDNPWANCKQLVWPIVTVGYRFAAVSTRMTRSTMLEVMREDYVRTARAKGLRERVVVVKHSLKNALLPVITIIGDGFALLIGGLVVTETVFTLNGVGGFVVDAIQHRDIPVLQSLVVLIAFSFVFVNLVIDLLYAWLDPRISY